MIHFRRWGGWGLEDLFSGSCPRFPPPDHEYQRWNNEYGIRGDAPLNVCYFLIPRLQTTRCRLWVHQSYRVYHSDLNTARIESYRASPVSMLFGNVAGQIHRAIAWVHALLRSMLDTTYLQQQQHASTTHNVSIMGSNYSLHLWAYCLSFTQILPQMLDNQIMSLMHLIMYFIK